MPHATSPSRAPDQQRAWITELLKPGTLLTLIAMLGGWGAFSVDRFVWSAQTEIRVTALEKTTAGLSASQSSISNQVAAIGPRLDGIVEMLQTIQQTQNNQINLLQREFEHSRQGN
jgi:hypothetical protein